MGVFRFKQFSVDDSHSAMKIGTDGVLLGAWTRAENARTVIDVGTGTGLVALMMAQRYAGVDIVGVDIDREACRDAVANVAASPWPGRVKIVEADVFAWAADDVAVGRPLCIVSNPPFFTETLRSPDKARALARHGEGLGVGSLIEWASCMMTGPDDSLSFIAPAERDDEVQYQLSLNRLAAVRMTDVVSREGRPAVRRLYEARREAAVTTPCVRETIVIREVSGMYSQPYIALTEKFYLDSTFSIKKSLKG